jgi:hypothetical protein
VGEATTHGGTTPPALAQLDDNRERKAPTLRVKSTRGKPLNVSIEPKNSHDSCPPSERQSQVLPT